MRLSASSLRLLTPVFSLALLLAAVFYMQPRAMSYTGLNLLFNLAVPIALATIAQMLIMAVNDLDLSMGTFVSFVVCVAATYLNTAPLIGVLMDHDDQAAIRTNGYCRKHSDCHCHAFHRHAHNLRCADAWRRWQWTFH
jgi:ribose/xylose/arabinose/galactoside ABC-type transport system permease subunit